MNKVKLLFIIVISTVLFLSGQTSALLINSGGGIANSGGGNSDSAITSSAPSFPDEKLENLNTQDEVSNSYKSVSLSTVIKDEEAKKRLIGEIEENLDVEEELATDTLDLLKNENIVRKKEDKWQIPWDGSKNSVGLNEVKEKLELENIESIDQVETLVTGYQLIEKGKLEKKELSNDLVENFEFFKKRELSKEEVSKKMENISSEEMYKIVQLGISEDSKTKISEVLKKDLKNLPELSKDTYFKLKTLSNISKEASKEVIGNVLDKAKESEKVNKELVSYIVTLSSNINISDDLRGKIDSIATNYIKNCSNESDKLEIINQLSSVESMGESYDLVAPLMVKILKDKSIKFDRKKVLNNLLKNYKKADSKDLKDAFARKGFGLCISTLAKLNSEYKNKVQKGLSLSGVKKDIWQKYSTLVTDFTREFKEEELNTIKDSLNILPSKVLSGLKIIAASDGSEEDHLGVDLTDAYGYANKKGVLHMIKTPSDMGEEGYVKGFMHELGHIIDFTTLSEKKKKEFTKLFKTSRKQNDILDYARIYGIKSRAEDFATCFEALITRPLASLSKALSQKENGNDEYWNKMEYMIDILSDDKGKVPYFDLLTFNNEGEEVGISNLDIEKIESNNYNLKEESKLNLGLIYETLGKELYSFEQKGVIYRELKRKIENGKIDSSEIDVSKKNSYFKKALNHFQDVLKETDKEKDKKKYEFIQSHIETLEEYLNEK